MTCDTDEKSIGELEHHVCDTLAQQEFDITNCQESVVTRADVFRSVDATAACPKGFVLFESGNFMVLGQGQTNLAVHFALECNKSGDSLMLRTFDGTDCSGDSQLTAYAPSVDDRVRDVRCAAHIRPFKDKEANECQWAKLKFWSSSAKACDAGATGELTLTLPMNMCVSANNAEAADLLGMELDQIRDDGLYWTLTTSDCAHFEASVFDNDKCDGEPTFAPRVVMNTEAVTDGVCFETAQCKVEGVEWRRETPKASSSMSLEEQIAIISGIGVVVFCAMFGCFLLFYHFTVAAKRTAVPQHDAAPNDSEQGDDIYNYDELAQAQTERLVDTV